MKVALSVMLTRQQNKRHVILREWLREVFE